MTGLRWMPLMGEARGLAIAMDLLSEHQAQVNHGQTLARLAERGGLSPCEALAIAEMRRWRRMASGEAIWALTKLAAAEREAPTAVDAADAACSGAVPAMNTGDTVRHEPSGEDWLVAFVEDGRLCACGWPCSFVPVTDCTLIEKATDEKRASLVREMAAMSGADPRKAFALRVLAANGEGASQ